MVITLAPNTESGCPYERESPTQTWLFLCSMYDWKYLKAVITYK